MKQDKVDLVAAHIARSIVNNDAINNEKDGLEDEEPDEEYQDGVVLEEIDDDSDEEEATDTAQQSEKMKIFFFFFNLTFIFIGFLHS